MKIEVLEERLRARVGEQRYDLERGDRVTVPDDAGRRWCAYGWVRDLSGEVPTAERSPGAVTITPNR